jgi:hypothetical protein
LSTMRTDTSSLVHATEDASSTFATVQINTASAGQAAHWVNIAQLDGIAVGDMINVNLDPSHPATAFQIHSESASGMTPAVSIGPSPASAEPVVSASTPPSHVADIHFFSRADVPSPFPSGAASFAFALFHV